MKGMLAKKREESNRKESFLEATIKLFLSIMGRINFLSLERYGKLNEKSYRNNFENGFDFLKYNKKIKVANYNNLVADFIFSNSEIPLSSNLITKIHDQLSHFGHIYGVKDDKICEL